MKNLILVLFFVIALGANAQDFGVRFGYGDYTGVAADTINGGSDADTIIFAVNENKLYLYNVEVDLTENSGSATYTGILSGALANSAGKFTDIDTLTATATGTIKFSDVSTGVMWKYLRVIGTISTTGKWTHSAVRVKEVPKP